MNHIKRLSASHIKKLALAIMVVGLLAIGVGVLAITTDTANAHDPMPHEHPHVQADDQPVSPERGAGPSDGLRILQHQLSRRSPYLPCSLSAPTVVCEPNCTGRYGGNG